MSHPSVSIPFLIRKYSYCLSVVDRGGGGARGPWSPGPEKISHKKDGHQRRPHRFHVSRPPLYPAAGSASVCFFRICIMRS